MYSSFDDKVQNNALKDFTLAHELGHIVLGHLTVDRANRMKILYERDNFLTHPLERKVYEQFRSCVKNR